MVTRERTLFSHTFHESRRALADANETGDRPIHVEFARKVSAQGRRLPAEEMLGLDRGAAVHAPESTTIDVFCPSLFPRLRHGRERSALKLRTLLDLQGRHSR